MQAVLRSCNLCSMQAVMLSSDTQAVLCLCTDDIEQSVQDDIELAM